MNKETYVKIYKKLDRYLTKYYRFSKEDREDFISATFCGLADYSFEDINEYYKLGYTILRRRVIDWFDLRWHRVAVVTYEDLSTSHDNPEARTIYRELNAFLLDLVDPKDMKYLEARLNDEVMGCAANHKVLRIRCQLQDAMRQKGLTLRRALE